MNYRFDDVAPHLWAWAAQERELPYIAPGVRLGCVPRLARPCWARNAAGELLIVADPAGLTVAGVAALADAARRAAAAEQLPVVALRHFD